jgi:hypothetical protein
MEAEAEREREPKVEPTIVRRSDAHKLRDFKLVEENLEGGLCLGCRVKREGKFCDRCLLCEECSRTNSCNSERQFEWCFACEHDGGEVPTKEVQDVLNKLTSACGEHFLILESFCAVGKDVWIIKVSCPEHYLRSYAEKIKFPMRLVKDEKLKLPPHGGPEDFVGVIPYVNDTPNHPYAFEINRFPLEPGQRSRRGYYVFNEPGHLENGTITFPLSCQQDQITWDNDPTDDDTVPPEDLWHDEKKVSTMFSSGERQQLIKRIIESKLEDLGANINIAAAEKNYRTKQEGGVDTAVENPVGARDGDDDVDDDDGDDGEDGEEQTTTISCIIDAFPLHDTYELAYLKRQWTTMQVPSAALRSFNLLGMTSTPLDSIKDYYGSQVAFYFAFLQLYTNYLIYPAVLGILTMAGHILDGEYKTLLYSTTTTNTFVHKTCRCRKQSGHTLVLCPDIAVGHSFSGQVEKVAARTPVQMGHRVARENGGTKKRVYGRPTQQARKERVFG